MLAAPARALELHPDAAGQSERLCARIADMIRHEGGWIGFDHYMQLALYEPGLGYYCGGAEKFGASGDFVTAPEISPLFGQALARQIADIMCEAGGDVLELGPGTGILAVDVLQALEGLGALPNRYLMLDVSATLRTRQRERIDKALPHLVNRVEWIDDLPDHFRGVVIANEVLDALPVRLITWSANSPMERGVTNGPAGFALADRPITDHELRATVDSLVVEPPYVSEVHVRTNALVRTLADRLAHGVILFVDYGFGSKEYYHPQRSNGTLMCHYNHHAHDDPFFLPGLQDITSHVNFTAVAQAGVERGLALLGYTTQAHFLVNCGITELLAAHHPSEAATYLRLSSQVQKLLSPSEMGELFKVITLGRGVGSELRGFKSGDLSRLL